MQIVEWLIFRKVAPRQIKYLTSLNYSTASGLSAEVLRQLEEDFVVGPPLILHMPNPQLFAGVWSMGRECLTVGRESSSPPTICSASGASARLKRASPDLRR